MRTVDDMCPWAITPGIAMRSPTTVVTSAAEMEGAMVARLALPADPISANASSTPQTVPSSPSIGARVTTVVGLLIAIPGVMAHGHLSSQVRNITADMEGFADELTGRIACEFQGRGA